MTIVVGLIVVITGSLINKEQTNQINIYFWLGLILDIVLLIVFIKITSSIKKHTKEIKEL